MSFETFKKMMEFDLRGQFCLEILFSVIGNEKFSSCWMGKMPDRETKDDCFWYGLTPDCLNAFDYKTFEEFAAAPVFDGKSLADIWALIKIDSINGCDPADMLPIYVPEN